MASNRKIVSLDDLLNLRGKCGDQTIVHCHGCFDIVHPGHIHHLQYAKSLGDILIVSVSSDAHVNKGVARPLIPDDLRADSLAALECVDAVYLNPYPTAVELLDVLQPHIFVKGREYESNADPRFIREKETVARNGGRVVFSSNDIVYSSTALIGAMTQTDPFQDEKLRRLCSRYELTNGKLLDTVQEFRGQRVVVIGDYILDRYHFCNTVGAAGEGPMLGLRALEQTDFDGGGAIIARHLAGLGAVPTLVTSLSDDENSEEVIGRLNNAGVAVTAIRSRRKLPTKHRYLVEETKVFKVDEGMAAPLDSRQEEQAAELILQACEGAAAVIFADFGYGLITAGLLNRVLGPLRKMVKVITADVSGRQANLLRFQGVDLLCPTEREMRETLHDFTSGMGAVTANLLARSKAKQALITLGKQGLVTFEGQAGPALVGDGRLNSEFIPAFAKQAVDTLGAGDALLATATLVLAVGGSLQAAALLGSLAAAWEVQMLGNQPIEAEMLSREISRREWTMPPVRLAS